MEFIQNNPYLPWSQKDICNNPNYIDKQSNHLNKSINWNKLSYNKELTLDIVVNNLNKDWNRVRIYYLINIMLRLSDYNYNLTEWENQLAKMFYWNTVHNICQPPFGYYFLNDIETNLPHDKKGLIQTVQDRACRFEDIKQLHYLQIQS
jgi:hypothetical protein